MNHQKIEASLMQVDLNKHKDYIVNELVYWVTKHGSREDIIRLTELGLEEEHNIKEAALSDKYMLEGDDETYEKHDYKNKGGGVITQYEVNLDS